MIKIIIVVVAIVGISTLYLSSQGDKDKSVDVTEQKTDISFETSGRVSNVNISVGDTVSKGQVLIGLENKDRIRELAQVKSDLRLQEKILKELKSGLSSKELRDIEKQKAKVESTGDSFKDAQKDLISILNESFENTDATVRNNIDQFIDDPKGTNPKIVFEISDSDLKKKIELARFAIEVILDDWSGIAPNLTVESGLLLVSEDTKDKLEQIKAFLDDVSIAVNSLEESDDMSAEVINEYVSDVRAAQTDVNNALRDISVAEEAIKEAEVSLTIEQNEFEQKIEGTNYEEILVQEAIVENIETIIKNVQAEIDETYLVAPVDGVVVEQEAQVGEDVSSGEMVIVIISQEQEEEAETEPQIEEEPDIQETDNTTTIPTYFGPIGSDGPITVELPNGETMELWPGWR